MKFILEKKLVLVLVVLILLSTFAVLFGFKFTNVVVAEEIEMSLIVEDSRIMGFNIDNEVLDFGKVPKGVSNMRSITIENNFDFPVTVKLVKKGEISGFVSLSDNDFLLSPGESKDIDIAATPSFDTLDKTYGGMLKVFFLK